MWKRSTRQPMDVGDPSLTEPLTDETLQQRTTNLNSGDFSISTRPAFGTRRSGDVLKGLPELPFKSLPFSGPGYRPVSNIPTTSSIYSGSTPDARSPQMHRLEISRSSSVYPDDVSPPESIRTTDCPPSRNGRNSPDISPIMDPSSAPADLNPGQAKFSSHIPVSKKPQVFGGTGSLFSRKTRTSTLSSAGRDSSTAILTRWDDFSGERTAGEKGKPASTSPDAVRRDVELKYGGRIDSLGNSVEISGPTRRVSSKAPWVPVGWKGAGGRHAVVNPMLDKPLPPGKSPSFPAGSHQRTVLKDHDKGKTVDWPGSSNNASSMPESRLPSAIPEHAGNYHAPVQCEAAYKTGITTGRPHQQRTPLADSPHPGLSPDDTRSPLARNPSNEEIEEQHPPFLSDSTSPGSRETEKTVTPEMTPTAHFTDFTTHGQPQSRFSASTFATTAYDSPPRTPEMNNNVSTPSSASSILGRKRPVQPAGLLGSKIAARKPTPSQLSTMEKNDDDKTRRLSKSLPKEPTEEKAVSRVESLQAKLDALRRRRGNLQTVIHELTNVVQPSSIAYDIASRQEIKKTVEGLNKELAEVIKQEHDTGLKLHRAWKRYDDSTAYEPTHLWVRRVTS